MSTVYATEPPTSGRVAVETTHGPLEVRLWCRECPATCRFFLQLCLDGYYDGMLFHRIVPGFLVQTGAVRRRRHGRDSSGAAGRKEEEAEAEEEGEMERYRRAVGADAALERRRYELHSRLRFSHRGIVAAALPARDDEDSESGGGDAASRAAARRQLQPQFFVTLDEAGFLDGKHVAFGTCSGPTFFNALRISQVEVDGLSHEPVDLGGAPRVTAVRILECPFDDLVPQPDVPWKKKKEAEEAPAQQKKRKGRLDKNVLSFGDEVEHDLLPAPAKRREAAAKEAAPKDGGVEALVLESHGENGLPDSFVAAEKGAAEEAAASEGGEVPTFDAHTSKAEEEPGEAGPKPKADQGRLRDRGEGAAGDPPRELPAGEEAAPASLVEARRARYARKGRMAAAGSAEDRRRREEETMAKLLAFRSSLKGSKRQSGDGAEATAGGGGPGRGGGDDGLASRMARRVQRDEPDGPGGNGAEVETYRGQVLDRDEEAAGAAATRSRDWMLTKFQCRKHTDFSADDDGAGGDGRRADDYRVVDDRRRQRDRSHGDGGSRGEERRDRKDRHPKRHEGHHQHRSDHRHA